MPVKTIQTLFPVRPRAYRGSFQIAHAALAAATTNAGATFFSMRWTSSSSFAIIRGATANCYIQASLTGTVPIGLAYAVARGFTVSDSGGAALAPTRKDSQNLATSFAAADVRVGEPVTAGTRTLDVPFAVTLIHPAAANGVQTITANWGSLGNDDPIILRANEGLVLYNLNQYTAGTLGYALRVEWTEHNNS